MSNLLTHARAVLSRSTERPVTYRITLKREPDADRATYEQQVESLTDDLEACIHDAASFESVAVSRTAGPYSHIVTEIKKEERRVVDLKTRLHEHEEGTRIWYTSSLDSVKSDLDEAAQTLATLYDDRDRMISTFVYRVDYEPKSQQTTETIISEFGRLSTLDGVETVEVEDETANEDPRNALDW